MASKILHFTPGTVPNCTMGATTTLAFGSSWNALYTGFNTPPSGLDGNASWTGTVADVLSLINGTLVSDDALAESGFVSTASLILSYALTGTFVTATVSVGNGGFGGGAVQNIKGAGSGSSGTITQVVSYNAVWFGANNPITSGSILVQLHSAAVPTTFSITNYEIDAVFFPVVVSSIAPSNGSAGGGTPVTITGTGFLNGVETVTNVYFGLNDGPGDGTATSVVVVNDTTITCVTPSGTGLVDVSVEFNNSVDFTLASAFTYTSTTWNMTMSAGAFAAPAGFNPGVGSKAIALPINVQGGVDVESQPAIGLLPGQPLAGVPPPGPNPQNPRQGVPPIVINRNSGGGAGGEGPVGTLALPDNNQFRLDRFDVKYRPEEHIG